MIAGHAAHVQVLDADAAVQPRKLRLGLAPIGRALALARQAPARALQPPQQRLMRLGPVMASPVLSVASVLMPRSTPTASLGCSTGLISSVSIMMLANQRSASRLTVTRFSLPVKRTASRIRTQPILGSLIRLASTRKVPVSLAAQKLSRTPLYLNRG